MNVFAIILAAALWTDVTVDVYPDADTVLVDERECVSYAPDGTSETTDEMWTKILTEKGRREESTITMSYSQRYEEARIVHVGAIDADGVEREIDVSKTTSEATDNSSMSVNIYDPLDREIVCTVPGLKIGEILHVKQFRKSFQARCEREWSDISVMEWSCPILRASYEVIAPKELPLKRVAIRHPLGNVVSNTTVRADGSTVHSFVVTNSPQAFAEPDMPPLYTQLQHLRVSTAADWPEISRWYWDLCQSHFAKTTPAMTNKVEELGRDLRRIFKFVSQDIRYMGLTMEDKSPGYAPHDVDLTFNNRAGVCRDKAALLVAMLRIAGFQAFPVLIHAGAKLDPEVPQPFFNHAIAVVDHGNFNYELMDPTDESTKDLLPAYLSDKSYLVARPEGDSLRITPVSSPELNAVVIDSNCSLRKNGSLFVTSRISFGGINDGAYRGYFAREKPENRVKFFERVLNRVSPGAEIVACEVLPRDMHDTTVPVTATLSVCCPEALMEGSSRSELSLPFLSRVLGVANFVLAGNTSLERRRFPLVTSSTAQTRERIAVELGQLGRPLELPRSDRGKLAGYDYRRDFVVSNGQLIANRVLSVGAVEFSPSDYLQLREEIKRAEAAERKRPVFELDRLAEADVHWITQSSETVILSDHAWVVTNSSVKQVLTYDGKKKSAELKLPFNPAVGKVELISAIVSNLDGRVSAVSAKDMNIMDCSWAAEAPRYPASKLLVVTLPSVEIGSVISCTAVTTITNAPVSFYSAYEFDSHEPIDRKLVRVNGWSREVISPARLPTEPHQPSALLWRDQVVVSSNDWNAVAANLCVACDVGEIEPADDRNDLLSIRNWMAKFVKINGPSLYEVPLAAQLTAPKTVMAERYATRLDYIRTMCAMLRGAGYDADLVFVASDADEPECVRRRLISDKPNARAFSLALCRVRVREGGFFGLGGEETVYFLGTESQYAPLGPSTYDGADYFDPNTCSFSRVTVPADEFSNRETERSEYLVRDNGAVDIRVENEICGSTVGAFRKKYVEMLPERRSREYQAILGNVAQAASATSELETDVESYPARSSFSCFVPDFATVQGDAISLQLPPLVSSIASYTGQTRQTPFAVASSDCEEECVKVIFPDGYTEAEYLPKPFVFADPADPTKTWLCSEVSSAIVDGHLEVTLRRQVFRRTKASFSPSSYELLKDWSRIADSRANRTITARRSR